MYLLTCTECIALLYYICYICMQFAHMVQSDLLLGLIPLRGEWKCVWMGCGGQCAAIPGWQAMQLWLADSLGIRLMVCIHHALTHAINYERWYPLVLSIFFIQLSIPTEVLAYTNAHFGQAQLPILLDDVACTGSESRLVDCPYDNNTGDCSHSQDAGTRCHPSMFVLVCCDCCIKFAVIVWQSHAFFSHSSY